MPVTNNLRQRDAAKTKQSILAAAQQAFADVGYTQAGIRYIAKLAGVDSALVQRYFGSKAGLFEAALEDAIPRFHSVQHALPDAGSRLTAELLAEFFDLRAQSMIVLSTSDAEARAISAKVLKRCAIEPLILWLGTENAEARAVRLIMMATTFMLYTRQVPLMSPERAVKTRTSQWLADQLQQIIDAPDQQKN